MIGLIGAAQQPQHEQKDELRQSVCAQEQQAMTAGKLGGQKSRSMLLEGREQNEEKVFFKFRPESSLSL